MICPSGGISGCLTLPPTTVNRSTFLLDSTRVVTHRATGGVRNYRRSETGRWPVLSLLAGLVG